MKSLRGLSILPKKLRYMAFRRVPPCVESIHMILRKVPAFCMIILSLILFPAAATVAFSACGTGASAAQASEAAFIPGKAASEEAGRIAGAGFNGALFDGCSQVIAVTADSMNTIYAALSTYQKDGGSWSRLLSIPARLGRDGLVLGSERIEGDMRTPTGVYSLPYAFGAEANPNTNAAASLPYKLIDTDTYYDGRYGSPTFNDFVEYKPESEYEYMYYLPAYRYGVNIGFNLEQIPGRGNGIFLHCSTESGYTAGCVSVSTDNMVKILQWLDRSRNPMIIICLSSGLEEYYF